MEFEQMLQLIDRVADKGLKSFCYENGDIKISIEGKSSKIVTVEAPVPAVVPQAVVPQAAAVQAAPVQPQETAAQEEAAPSGKIVKSPLVGTFYAAPAEDAEPFVQVGDRVKKGQILAIVEAMKLMNDIESEFDGEIAEIYAENGKPVEYGQPLFRIV